METALYLPVKRFLEKLGFTVKGEVGGCDLVALSGGDPPDRGDRRTEAYLQSRTGSAGGRSRRRLRRGLDRREIFGARQGARKRCALPQSLPAARLRHACRDQHRRCRGDRQAGRPQPRAAIRKSAHGWFGASAPQGRSGSGRKHARTDHDGVSPAGAGLCRGAGAGPAAGARPEGRQSRMRQKYYCTTSMAGSTVSSAAFTN